VYGCECVSVRVRVRVLRGGRADHE
jgi:hypothetical protein